MYLTFLKFCMSLSLISALVVFIGLEFNFPIDLVSYVSTKLNQSVFDTTLWLQAVSLVFFVVCRFVRFDFIFKNPYKS